MSGCERTADATVSVRNRETLAEHSTAWGHASVDLLTAAMPWRTFRWYRGQKHYSGVYWSSTESSHVIYESRLELSRLLYADHDAAVHRIVAQPFLLKAVVGGRVRRHVPDFLLVDDQEPIVVDVKPAALLDNPRVAFTLEWTKTVVEMRGWRYEVWSEPPVAELANIRFLAGFRNPRCFDQELLAAVRREDFFGRTLDEALSIDIGQPPALVRSAVLHTMWNQFFTTDLRTPLSSEAILAKGRRP